MDYQSNAVSDVFGDPNHNSGGDFVFLKKAANKQMRRDNKTSVKYIFEELKEANNNLRVRVSITSPRRSSLPYLVSQQSESEAGELEVRGDTGQGP